MYHKCLKPFATFIAIVGVILLPLSKFGGIYAWPCGRVALTVSLFYVGCIIAEWIYKVTLLYYHSIKISALNYIH